MGCHAALRDIAGLKLPIDIVRAIAIQYNRYANEGEAPHP